MAKDYDPHRLDVRRFAEEGAELTGEDGLRRYHRLSAETQGGAPDRPVTWQARGELLNPRHVHPQVWLHLDVAANLPLVCQRCLAPVEMPLAVRRSFRFVPDEATAAAEDDAAEEDLLALSHSFDLLELVEDELLMEVPVAPMHEVCPQPVKMSAVDDDFDTAGGQRENPFAVLGRIKAGK
ncbi:YceD family protein [Ramlibacter sp. PS3R-8]|uniref:YceD family protein n=1 Tax=Ramlibacter sp. PS3R-8 TaxID=3133437 RepID=UPI0030A23EAC